jgi:hypothetical protein
VGVRKSHGEGFGPSEVPGAASAASRVVGEAGTNPERQQSGDGVVSAIAATELLAIAIGSNVSGRLTPPAFRRNRSS